MNEAIIISDTHLGSGVCESKQLYNFLELVYNKTNKLIINGDFFDNLDFRRLKKKPLENTVFTSSHEQICRDSMDKRKP